MNIPAKPSWLSISILFLALAAASLAFQGCGGSKESTSSSPSKPAEPKSVAKPKAVAETKSAAPTMENMKVAVVDAMKTISTNTVAEITKMAKKDEAIQIPPALETVKSSLESMGKSDMFTGLTSSLNSSAASALVDYKDVISKTIGTINLPDVEKIIQGGDDSMTRYLENTASTQLKENLIPFVKDALKDTQAEGWLEKIKDAIPEDTGGLLGKVQAATGIQMPTNLNLESYLTDELMSKIFDVMANQEKLFRQNPKGRSADLFKKVMEAAQ